MSQNTSAFSASLKNVYIDKIREQINQLTNLLDFFTEKDVTQYKWEGAQLVFDLHKTRNASGVKAVSEGGGLPVAGQQGTINMLVPTKFWEGRIQLTAQVMKASQTSRGAFISAMNLEQKGLVEDVSRQRNRALAYFGQGTLAVISAGAASVTQTLKNPGGVTGTVNPVRFIQIGMIIAVTDSTGIVRGTATVTDIPTASTITLDASLTTTTNDLVSIGTNSLGVDESSFNLEPMGILGIDDATTYVSNFDGIDASLSTNSFWRSTVNASTGALSEDVLQRVTDNVWEVSGEVVNKAVCHVSVRREVIKLTQADRRYMGSSKPENFDAGSAAGAFKADITYNGVTYRPDKDFAYGTIALVNTDHLLYFPFVKGEWVDEDGDVLFRVQNTDAFEARYRQWENFGTDRRNSLGRLDGVTATVSSGVFSS